MSASASLSLAVGLRTPAQAAEAHAIVDATAGASHVSVDPAAGTASFRFVFPGNIDRLVERLQARGIGVGPDFTISVPVRNQSGRTIDAGALLAHLKASPVVLDAAYDGLTVGAKLVTQTSALRYLFEEVLLAGLMPVDEPTVAGALEFVL